MLFFLFLFNIYICIAITDIYVKYIIKFMLKQNLQKLKLKIYTILISFCEAHFLLQKNII
jgi:hypothetical protein